MFIQIVGSGAGMTGAPSLLHHYSWISTQLHPIFKMTILQEFKGETVQ
jgi:hypothetical protein